MRSSQLTSISNVRLGRPDTKPDAPAHTRGVLQGNRVQKAAARPGLNDQAGRLWAQGTAQRSTGINPDRRNPIDPTSPNLPPG